MGYVNQIWRRCQRLFVPPISPVCPPSGHCQYDGFSGAVDADAGRGVGGAIGRERTLSTASGRRSARSARRLVSALGPPEVDVEQMLEWTANWKAGGKSLETDKIRSRSGRF